MSGSPPKTGSRVWDVPLRLWHWALAGCIATSLYTGLDGDIGLMELHQTVGVCVVGLLVFRLLWALWGGTYARLRHYWTTPGRIVDHFRGVRAEQAHTAPGIALVGLLLLAVATQALTGLATTDHIFNEGPLVGYVSDEVSRTATALHHLVFWVVIGAVGIHLTAHAVYAVWLRDPTPLSMITGRKKVAVPDTRHYWVRALVTAAVAAAVAWFLFTL